MRPYHAKGISLSADRSEITIDQTGIRATYPWVAKTLEFPVEAIMMDLDGTSITSEHFWMGIIEKTCQIATGDPSFHLHNEDAPFVSGFTTQQHLAYCIAKYGIHKTVEECMPHYHHIAAEELKKAMNGGVSADSFLPRKGWKDFLFLLKSKGIKIGLATSGLEYKAIPEIVSAFRKEGLGNPLDFYDAIITGGKRKGTGEYGTVGELAGKPHPWIYKELSIGLNLKDLSHTVALEDSSAGVISAKTAGFPVIGFKDGNLIESGLDQDCIFLADTFDDVAKFLHLIP